MEILDNRPLHRCNSAPCLEEEQDEEEMAARLAQCTRCLKKLRELASSQAPAKSSLKVSSQTESLKHSVTSSASSKSSGVHFGTVELHEHPYLLGCHPDVRKGPPTTISWCPSRSVTSTVDDFEAEHGPQRRPTSAFRMASTERRERLLETGYTLDDLERVKKEISEIQKSRELSATETTDLKRLMKESKRKQQEKKMKRRGLRRFLSM
jgi:hypothetical protein